MPRPSATPGRASARPRPTAADARVPPASQLGHLHQPRLELRAFRIARRFEPLHLSVEGFDLRARFGRGRVGLPKFLLRNLPGQLQLPQLVEDATLFGGQTFGLIVERAETFCGAARQAVVARASRHFGPRGCRRPRACRATRRKRVQGTVSGSRFLYRPTLPVDAGSRAAAPGASDTLGR